MVTMVPVFRLAVDSVCCLHRSRQMHGLTCASPSCLLHTRCVCSLRLWNWPHAHRVLVVVVRATQPEPHRAILHSQVGLPRLGRSNRLRRSPGSAKPLLEHLEPCDAPGTSVSGVQYSHTVVLPMPALP